MNLESHDDNPPVYEFGWWPEITGLVGSILLAWFLITFARGIL